MKSYKKYYYIILFPFMAYGRIINVPTTNYPTIQSAIDSSINGDTVLVAPGEYLENINFHGKSIMLASNFILNSDTSFISRTIINGNNKNSVVTIRSGEDSTTTLIGLTIKNGNSLFGAGIYCENSNPSIKYLNIIKNRIEIINNTNAAGAGIYFENCKSCLYNVNIDSNLVQGYNTISGTSTKGIGIYAENSNLNIKHSKIMNNYAYAVAYGIGMYLLKTTANLDSCLISKNYPQPSGLDGGGIYADRTYLKLLNSTLSQNYAYSRGGGACLINMFRCDIENSIIEKNGASKGGGLYILNSNPNISNSKFIGNGAMGGGIYLDASMGNLQFDTFQNNSANFGGGIYFKNSNPNLYNISVFDNTVGGSGQSGLGGGFYFNNSNPVITKLLLYSNKSYAPYASWSHASSYVF